MQAQVSTGDNVVIDRPASWGGVFALALGAFSLVASEFMPVSLLTSIATDLKVTEGQAGQAIAVSGVFALVTSLFISRLAGKLDRKTLLVALTALMIVSGTIASFAPNYLTFMIGRAFIGIAIGGFWSMSAATAMRLVSREDVPRALAILNGGNALATVLAAPMGSVLGAMIGWRGAFFCLIPVAVIALAWKMLSLPSMAPADAPRQGNVFALLKPPPIALGMLAVSVFFMGQFALFTYLRPFLETITRTSAATTSLMLLIVGVAGFAGTVMIGGLLKNRLYSTLIVIPLMMAIVASALIAFGSSAGVTAGLLAIWGLAGTSAPVGWWTWLARTLPDNAEAGGGLMVAVVQFAIASGAAFGGILFDGYGYQATFGVSAVILLAATVLAILAARATRLAARANRG